MDQNQNSNTMNNNPEAGERTFTQEDVNRILGERLSKEKARADAAFAEREQQFAEREKELANREALFELKDQLKEMGLPAELLPVLNVTDRDKLNTALDALKAYVEEQAKDKNQYEVLVNRLHVGEYPRDTIDSRLKKAFEIPKK